MAARLAELGVGVGDRVAIAAGNRPEVLLAYLGCWALGAVAQPLNLSASDGALGISYDRGVTWRWNQAMT